MRTTPIKILNKGNVKILGGQEGYSLKGNNEAVCFMVDVSERVEVVASGSNWDNTPQLWLCDCHSNGGDVSETVISFPEFKGWRVHSAKGGKNLSVALTNDYVDLV